MWSLRWMVVVGLLTLVWSVVTLGLQTVWLSPKSAEDHQWFSAKIEADNLILVAGHSTLLINNLINSTKVDITDANNWYFLSWQKRNELEYWLNHIETALKMAAEDDRSIVIFSGGKSRTSEAMKALPVSEGQAYRFASSMLIKDKLSTDPISAQLDWNHVEDRLFTEDFARDTFENLLFSLCRFRQLTGHYPKRLSVVTYFHKCGRVARYLALLRYPTPIKCLGAGLIPSDKEMDIEVGLMAAKLKDLMGCNGDLAKKHSRNPHFQVPPYPNLCPELSPIFNYCNQHHFRTIQFPWEAGFNFLGTRTYS
eukprot:Platyproteum_vivax@DN5573_c0_g1_i2.p1